MSVVDWLWRMKYSHGGGCRSASILEDGLAEGYDKEGIACCD